MLSSAMSTPDDIQPWIVESRPPRPCVETYWLRI